MRPESDPTESNPEGSGSGSGSASKSYISSSAGVHPSYPSNPAGRINTSEKRLTLVHSAHGDDQDDQDDDNDDGLYKTPSRRTDLDSVEAGHYHRGGMTLPGLRYDDEVIDIVKPSEVHRY